jgi:hypothetical protein
MITRFKRCGDYIGNSLSDQTCSLLLIKNKTKFALTTKMPRKEALAIGRLSADHNRLGGRFYPMADKKTQLPNLQGQLP